MTTLTRNDRIVVTAPDLFYGQTGIIAATNTHGADYLVVLDDQRIMRDVTALPFSRDEVKAEEK